MENDRQPCRGCYKFEMWDATRVIAAKAAPIKVRLQPHNERLSAPRLVVPSTLSEENRVPNPSVVAPQRFLRCSATRVTRHSPSEAAPLVSWADRLKPASARHVGFCG